jgi:Domain of unknown function (DUF4375)
LSCDGIATTASDFNRRQPQMRIIDRLLRLVKIDSASRSARKFFRDYANRTRYPQLTRETLQSIDELDFDSAVVDYVDIVIDGKYDRAIDIVSKMSPGIQAVYSTWWVQAEVDNGGLHQYFCNKGVEWAFKAVEGYKLLGAPKHTALVTRAIELYLEEEVEQKAFYRGNLQTMIEDYVEARKASDLPALDSLFYALEDEYIIGLAFEYMKRHLDEFVTPGQKKAT